MPSPSRTDSVARALGEDLGDVELQERSSLTMFFVLALPLLTVLLHVRGHAESCRQGSFSANRVKTALHNHPTRVRCISNLC